MIAIDSRRRKLDNIRSSHPGLEIIDVTSKGPEPWVRLSPFYPHGEIPVPFSPGVFAQSVEGVWQGLKVFESESIDMAKFSVANMKGIKRSVKTRGRVLGHQAGTKSETLLGYLEARIQIYLPTYRWVLENKLRSEIEQLREKYNPRGDAPVIGVVARHLELKGIQHIIPAFARLLETHPSARLLLFYASGPYRKTIEGLLESIPDDRFLLVEFEPDLYTLYHLFDLYVHVPIGPDQESFGLTFIEALAAGVPSVFTLSGVGPEFLVHRENAWIVDYASSDQIYEGLMTLLKDEKLREEMVRRGRKSIERFDYLRMIRRLETFYLRARSEK